MRKRAELFLLPALILLVNVLIAGRLFSVEYSKYLESNEGTFIALARHVAEQPWDLGWWPLWEGGLPFVNTYLPGLPLTAGWYSRWTGASPALAFHQVSTLFYCSGPVFFYFLMRAMAGRSSVAFFTALAYSTLSPCAWFSTLIRADLADVFRLRRLQTLAYYGEAPIAASMAMLPVALWMLHLALTRKRFGWWVLAGAAMGATVLFNAFGAVLLAIAGVCWLASVGPDDFKRAALGLMTTAALAYVWISPLMPPSVITAIRANSPTVDGDYRFTERSALGVLTLIVAFGLAWWVLRKAPAPLRFFALFALLSSGIVLLGTEASLYVVPQPHRYQLAMDLGLCAFGVLAIAEMVKNHAFARRAVAVLSLLFLIWTARHNVRFARGLIQSREMISSAPFRIARWADANLKGQRIMLFGSHIFQFNDFTDTPQVFGGHKPFVVNRFMRTVEYAVQTGQNAGEKDGEISVLWLKALGAGAVVVPGPESAAHYKPPNPRKFEGLLPVFWQERGDTIYGVPSRDHSLAHVIPSASLVVREPIHGLDVEDVRRYVAALEDISLPLAQWSWNGSSAASIHTALTPGQVLSVQVNHDPGWRATANGQALAVERDALGLIVLRPACSGLCEVMLQFDGGSEARFARYACTLTILGVLLGLARGVRRKR